MVWSHGEKERRKTGGRAGGRARSAEQSRVDGGDVAPFPLSERLLALPAVLAAQVDSDRASIAHRSRPFHSTYETGSNQRN